MRNGSNSLEVITVERLSFLAQCLVPTLISFTCITGDSLVITQSIKVTLSLANQLLTTLNQDTLKCDVIHCSQRSLCCGTVLYQIIQILYSLSLVIISKCTLCSCQVNLRKTDNWNDSNITKITTLTTQLVQIYLVGTISCHLFGCSCRQEHIVTNIFWV